MSSPINNNLPAVRSKFLLACAGVLSEAGCTGIIPFSQPGQESISFSWFPPMPHGGACFDVGGNEWQFSNVNPEGENLMVDIAENGNLTIREGNDGGAHLILRIEDPDELGEVLEFYGQINETQLGAPVKWMEMPLSSIIEAIHLVIPKDGHDLLLPFNPIQLRQEQPLLWQPIKFFSVGELPEHPFTNWAQWVADHADWNKMPPLLPLGIRDSFYSSAIGLQSWRVHSLRETEFFDPLPKLALRISPKHSRLFFHTYLRHSREGLAVMEGLELATLDPTTFLKQTHVLYPTTLPAQRRQAVEFRAVFNEYQITYKKLCDEREPVRDLAILTRRRTQHIGRLHSEYLAEIEAISAPLPFFLEYPFRRYARADDDLNKISRGQQWFSIVARSLVLLPLEEALNLRLWPEFTGKLSDELKEKPLSDGSWLELFRRLSLAAAATSAQLPLFGSLLQAANGEMDLALKRILKARNNFHHPPNDAKTLLRVMREDSRLVMNALRSVLGHVSFIVPESLSFEHGKRSVNAHVLEGYESDFRVCRLAVNAPLESFPTGQLIAINNRGEHPLPFTHYLRSQPVKTATLDVGIFDKIVGSAPHYEFVRGYGDQADWTQPT